MDKNDALRVRKPDWLRVKLGSNDRFSCVGQTVHSHGLHTICQSGKCPNLGECWDRGTATFMIAGEICTRACRFCNTLSGRPQPLDAEEPRKVAESIAGLGVRHAVITSVDRDDLPDYGAAHWAKVIRAVKEQCLDITLEVLIPDFRGVPELIEQILHEGPEIVSHNLETVRRLTPEVRSVATYETSLHVLHTISEMGGRAKSGLMLGLGETDDEVFETMDDLLAVGCRLLSIGQYLQPSRKNIEVKKYIHPGTFASYREIAIDKGFTHVESGPLVRSSYRSADYL